MVGDRTAMPVTSQGLDYRFVQAARKRGLNESIPASENWATVLGVGPAEYSRSMER
jgi:hypothetical protein